MSGRHGREIERRPSAPSGPPAPGPGPPPQPDPDAQGSRPASSDVLLVLPPLSLAAPAPPGLFGEPGCGVPAETYQGRESSQRVVRAARRQSQQRASPPAQDPQGGRKSRKGPAPWPPPSFLYCDWKPGCHPSPRLAQSSSRTRARVRPRPPSALIGRSPSGRPGGPRPASLRA